MFSNFAWSEMLLIAVVAIIVVGPKDLPAMLRTFGKTLGSVKRMAGDFQRQFNDALKEAELDDIKDIASTKGFAPLEDAKKSMEEFAQTMKESAEVETEIEAEAPKNSVKTEATKKPAARKAAPKKAAHSKTKATAAKPAAAARKASPKRAAPKKAATSRSKSEAKSAT